MNGFLEAALQLGEPLKLADGRRRPPGILDGDTSMGNCVTSAWFQGFKVAQKKRLQHALRVIPEVARLFEEHFGRPGLTFFERHGMEDDPEVVLICMGPDAGTAIQLLPRLRDHLVMKGADGAIQIRPGREADVAALQSYADRNVERLQKLCAPPTPKPAATA